MSVIGEAELTDVSKVMSTLLLRFPYRTCQNVVGKFVN